MGLSTVKTNVDDALAHSLLAPVSALAPDFHAEEDAPPQSSNLEPETGFESV